ncbi:TonB-dependent siderophore receptor [Methylobacterium sp. DB0501]|uniref:TonB-dependent siderophore receptor n=1 Tax=Methylobacterium sp. DB0501 TaxID=2709665 RepID=UPI0013EA01E9|nr:TonB-dependent siderophore receptor [Methylobacterium sp. DB0501]NGM32595.1 TonB-dependent siderophore receptor [Methylobacterium sp. DB0501]
MTCALPGIGLKPQAAAAQAAADVSPEIQLDEISVAGSGGGNPLKTEGYLARTTVSATRTDTPLREVPQTVVPVPRQVLEDAAATRIDTALDLAGVGRANNFGGLGLTEFTIRGFATGEYYRNGFPINRGYPNSPDIVSIERIEVLKGPSAFLYGRGDPGGTFNIVTKQPSAERSFAIGTQFGSDNAKRSTFDATGALDEGGTVLARLTGAVEDNGSFRDFVHGDRYYLAPVIAWKPNADTTVTLEGEFISGSQIFDRGILPLRGDLRAVPRSRYIGEPGLPPFRNDNALGQLRVEHRLNSDWVINAGAQLLAGNLAGQAVQATGTVANNGVFSRTYDRRELTWSDLDLQINLAGKFETGAFRHTLLVGLERDSLRYREAIPLISNPTINPFALNLLAPVYGQPLPVPTRLFSNFLQNTTSYAGYVQDQIDLTPKLHALVGVRVEDIALDTVNYINGTTTRQRGNAATPRIGLVYDVTEIASIFGNYSQSFRPNAGTDRTGRPFPFQQAESVETGVKLSLLDGRLDATAAFFDIRRTNQLVTDPVDTNFQAAAGAARSRGFDMSVAGFLAPGWRVIGTYAFVDAALTKATTAPVGARLANIPQNSFAVQSVYEFQDGPLRGLGLGGGITYVGSRFAGETRPTFKLPEYTLANLISYYRITPDVRVYLNVDNLFDERYFDRSWQNRYATPGLPRTIMGGVAARF